MYNSFVTFVKQLYGSQQVPLHAPVFLGNEKKYLNECIDTTFVSSVGKFVDQFEEQLATFTGAKKVVACVNGTNALFLSLKLVGVEKGDEVLTQPLTFVATCNSIAYLGASPVFIDVDIDTMGMSPVSLRKWLFENAIIKDGSCYNKINGNRIKACLPMHTFGHPVKIDEIKVICDDYNIELVEDAAEALGTLYKGKHVGNFGKVGVISFNGNKILTTGGGGALMFNDLELAERAKHLITQAKVAHSIDFAHDEVGYNLRMPNVNAAIGCAQIENINQFLASKRETANLYNEFFQKEGISFFTESENCQSNYWLNVVLMDNRAQRDDFLKYTNQNGVMTRPAWVLMNKQPMYIDCMQSNLDNAQWLEDRIVNIPSSVRIKL
jgi:aminotransferase in exopolysaccharide biosynthesis